MSDAATSDAVSEGGKSGAIVILGLHLGVGVILALLSFGIFMMVADWVTDGGPGVVRFDRGVLTWMHSHQRPGLTEAARVLAWMGSPPVILGIGAIGTIAGCVRKSIRGAAWTFPIAVLGAGIIIQSIKLAVHRTRPDLFKPLLHESGYSFPSGHSLIAVVVYGLIGYFALSFAHTKLSRIAVTSLTALVILAIGVSRVYVGVHYPTDVLAGWTAGVSWLMTCIWLHEVMVRRWTQSGTAVLQKFPQALA